MVTPRKPKDQHKPDGRSTDFRPEFVEQVGRGLLTLSQAKKIIGSVVYGLSDGTDIFYIGRTKNPRRRFQDHREARVGRNVGLYQKLKVLGPTGVFVDILAFDPIDPVEVELLEIERREGTILNIAKRGWCPVSGGHKPWTGKPGHLPPSAIGLKITDPARKPVARAAIARMTDIQRCSFEIALFQDYPRGHQRRLEAWLTDATPSMISCLTENATKTD